MRKKKEGTCLSRNFGEPLSVLLGILYIQDLLEGQLRSSPATALTSLACSLGELLSIVPLHIWGGEKSRNRFCRPEAEVWICKVA
jgi:hypothetical protein